MSINVLPKMLNTKELHIMTLDDKSVVYEMGNFGLNDDDFETMGFSEVYGITKRIAPITGTYYQTGSGTYVVINEAGVYTIDKTWETCDIEEKHNCVVIIQVSESGIMYIKH